jgi:hypothetical protein
MNGAQLLMANSDSSGLMNGPPATQSFVDGQMRAARPNKSESAQIPFRCSVKLAGFAQTTAGIRPNLSSWVTLMPYVFARRRDVRFGFGRNNYCDRGGCVAHPAGMIGNGKRR